MMSPSAKPVQKLSKERYNSLAPRFWHGMGFGTWMKLLARNKFRISPSRIPTALSITMASTFNSLCGLLESAIYGRSVSKTEIKQPPVFIIGHWRSGTTLLHELLVKDPNHAYPNTCQCFAAKHFLLTEKAITSCLGFVMPKQRPMDNMELGWRKPQEDEFALCNLGVPSPYLFLPFPDHGPVFDDYLTLENVTREDREVWKRELKRFIQKLTYRMQKRLVVKSPPHTGRIRALLEIFPDAQFIHIVRDPFAVYSSTIRLWQSLGYIQSMRIPHDDSWLPEYVLRSLESMYENFEEDKALLRSDQLTELHYESLIAQPVPELQRVYEELHLGNFEDVRPAIENYFANRADYKTNRHEISDKVREMISHRWSHFLQMYGYEIPVA